MHELRCILDIAHQTAGAPAALATVVETTGSVYRRAGARMLVTAEGETVGAVSGGCLEREVARVGLRVMATGQPQLLTFDTRRTHGCDGTLSLLVENLAEGEGGVLRFLERQWALRETCSIATIFAMENHGGPPRGSYGVSRDRQPVLPRPLWEQGLASITSGKSEWIKGDGREVFFDVLHPPIRLLIFGSRHDSLPLVKQACQLGWEIELIAHPDDAGDVDRFPHMPESQVIHPAEVAQRLKSDAYTAAVIMTHHFARDLAFLDAVLAMKLPYLGLLGSRRRRDKLLTQLSDLRVARSDESWLEPDFFDNTHGPAGLDLGAETPEEIALSVAGEILRVFRRRSGVSLKGCQGPIHSESYEIRSRASRSRPVRDHELGLI